MAAERGSCSSLLVDPSLTTWSHSAGVQTLADQLGQELSHRVAAEALTAAVGQVRIELMVAIISTTDQLRSIAAAMRRRRKDASAGRERRRYSSTASLQVGRTGKNAATVTNDVNPRCRVEKLSRRLRKKPNELEEESECDILESLLKDQSKHVRNDIPSFVAQCSFFVHRSGN